jgi:hypothetical protein
MGCSGGDHIRSLGDQAVVFGQLLFVGCCCSGSGRSSRWRRNGPAAGGGRAGQVSSGVEGGGNGLLSGLGVLLRWHPENPEESSAADGNEDIFVVLVARVRVVLKGG